MPIATRLTGKERSLRGTSWEKVQPIEIGGISMRIRAIRRFPQLCLFALLKENETGGMDTATRSKLSGIKMNELRGIRESNNPWTYGVKPDNIARRLSVFGSVSSISWRNELFGWLKDSYFSSCCSFFLSLSFYEEYKIHEKVIL